MVKKGARRSVPVVVAEWRADEPGTEAWAGIGWIQDPDLGRGLFVEHEGGSEAQVQDDLTAADAEHETARTAAAAARKASDAAQKAIDAPR